jgi:ubiquitin carboxyl-terminal hydrolase L3
MSAATAAAAAPAGEGDDAQTNANRAKAHWIPLESNPEVITAFARRLGMPKSFAFHDVYGLDDDLLVMVPQPVRALILLFPITPASERFAKEKDAELEASGVPVCPEGLFYMKQTIGNACGTIAMLHAIANSRDAMGLGCEGDEEGDGAEDAAADDDENDEQSFLRRFLAATTPLSPAERGRYLERPPQGAPDLEAAHRRAAERGATAAPAAEDDVDLHFVALVPALGKVWELDGRRRGAVEHGPLSDGVEGFLSDAAEVARAFVAREAEAEGGGSLQFSLIALGPADDDEED